MDRFECPYWRSERRGERLYCEGGAVFFRCPAERWAYVKKYCCHPEGWRTCTLARALEESYEKGWRK